MGRPKTSFPDLPQHMTARPVGRKVHYYHQAGGRKTALGTDKAQALRQWAILEAGSIDSGFLQIADAFWTHIEPLVARSTAKHYRGALDNLCKAFAKGTLDQIKPFHVKQYITRRTKKGAAIFEKRVLSAMWNWARGAGMTETLNPCAGIKFSQAEKKLFKHLGKRSIYVTDEMFADGYSRADPIMQDAMDLAYLTGQRPSDLLKMTRQDMKDGTLLVVQGKTGAKVPIRIEGALKRVLERALARPRRIKSMYVIADEDGQRLPYMRFYKRFRKLGVSWQFRDIRAKTSSDLPTLRQAQQLLGHATETTTTLYRRSKGVPISPLEPEA